MIRLAIILPTLGLPLAYATIGNTYGNWNAEISPQYGGNCYSDLVGNMRTLWGIAQGVNSGAMTIEMCLNACGSQGFNIAGVEYSQECWCGNSIQGENGPLPSSSCNMACRGDETEICGGSAAMNLWVMNNFNFTHGPAGILRSYGNYQFMQCWDDYYANFRVLAHQPSNPPPGNDMTVAGCINACAADGYSSAGLEYASECFCDNKVYPIGQSDNSNCDMPCSGDASEICGGPNRLLAYFNPSSTSTSSTSTGTSTSSTSTSSTSTSSTSTSTCVPNPTGLSGVLYGDFECGTPAPWGLQISDPSAINGTVDQPGLTGNWAVDVEFVNLEAGEDATLTSPTVAVQPSTAYKLTWGAYIDTDVDGGYQSASVNNLIIVTIGQSQYISQEWAYIQIPWTSLSTDTSAQVTFEWGSWLGGRLDTVVLSEITAWCGSDPPLGLLPDGEFECGLGAWTMQVPDPACEAGVGSNAAATSGWLGEYAWVVNEPQAPVSSNTQGGVSARIVSPPLPVVPGETYMLSFVTYFSSDYIGFIGVVINNEGVYTRDPADKPQNGPTVFSPNGVFWTAGAGVTNATVSIEALFALAGTMMVDGVIFVQVNPSWSGMGGN